MIKEIDTNSTTYQAYASAFYSGATIENSKVCNIYLYEDDVRNAIMADIELIPIQ